MKTILAAGFALATTVLSILVPNAPAVAEANSHGYVNYRNYDEGPESLAAFRAYHRARSRAALQPESGILSAAGVRGVASPSPSDRTAKVVGAHCDLAPRGGSQTTGAAVASC